MGLFTFSLPPNLPPEVTQDLERVSVTGGPDAMPTPVQVQVEPAQLTVDEMERSLPDEIPKVHDELRDGDSLRDQ